ncbi:DNA cytosine methyltransferase [Cytobacillus solani]|uniref:DNA cytosine methyltransferase n=1 Tax=Cytobacillus solani TaxID=1637975 RepID=UPI00207A6F18|nr:DNA cytosine methyltransferase [Cytobacillus solani]USK54387.1 DNA cytosine methyltransferase [Cytobacillus solani]
MKSIELFAGIGGIALAAEWAGIETVALCERDPFCQQVLNKHWPSVPIFDDICTLNKQALEERGVDVGTIELISGGYPCQPFSVAGERKGEDDDRHLWPEVKRLLQEIQPTWFVGENVAGHITLGLDTVLFDLESIGYTWQPFIIPACAVNAPHRRDRVFIVAYSDSKSRSLTIFNRDRKKGKSRNKKEKVRSSNRFFAEMGPKIDSDVRGWETELAKSRLVRSDDGIPYLVDRLRSLGNAVVPQQIYPILKFIKQINDMET